MGLLNQIFGQRSSGRDEGCSNMGTRAEQGHKFASSENARPPAQLFFFRASLTHFRHRHRDATHIPWGPGGPDQIQRLILNGYPSMSIPTTHLYPCPSDVGAPSYDHS